MSYPKSVLQINEIKVISTHFEFEDEIDLETYEVKLEDQVTTNTSDDIIHVKNELTIYLEDKNKLFDLQVKIKGTFTVTNYEGMTDKEIDYIIKTSTTTILFPYLRSYVTSMTSLAGLTPITLPIINVGKAMKLKENQ